jgi:thioredoxin 1
MTTKLAIEDEKLRQLANSHKTVLIDFWASYCGPCKQMSPTIDQLAVDYKDQASIVKMNVEEYPEAAAELRIMGVPTVVLFQGGIPQDMLVGFQSKEALQNLLNRYV